MKELRPETKESFMREVVLRILFDYLLLPALYIAFVVALIYAVSTFIAGCAKGSVDHTNRQDAGEVIIDARAFDVALPDSSNVKADTGVYIPLRILTFVWAGNPTGSYISHRYCAGSPVLKGDNSTNAYVSWKPWYHQAADATKTWINFNGDLYDTDAIFTRGMMTRATDSLRFQCFDDDGIGHVRLACSPLGVFVHVYEGADATFAEVPVSIITNGVDEYDCQIQ